MIKPLCTHVKFSTKAADFVIYTLFQLHLAFVTFHCDNNGLGLYTELVRDENLLLPGFGLCAVRLLAFISKIGGGGSNSKEPFSKGRLYRELMHFRQRKKVPFIDSIVNGKSSSSNLSSFGNNICVETCKKQQRQFQKIDTSSC